MSEKKPDQPARPMPPKVNMFGLLGPYKKNIGLLLGLAVVSNALNLAVPKLLAHGIDTYTAQNTIAPELFGEFLVVTIAIFLFSYLQNVTQTFTSELVARDLRRDLTKKVARQSYLYIQEITPSVLLTNLTSDIDAIKNFVAQAVATIAASVFLIIGASVLLLMTNWRLALLVLLIVPVIGITFAMVLSKVRVLFGKGQGIIDHLNKVINESILGAAVIRVLDSQKQEHEKFIVANKNARDTGLQILGYFSMLVPTISFVASMATLAILTVGGHFVISGSMSLGDFAAFNSYVGILIFPIIMIGFMSNVIARSSASYARVLQIINAQEKELFGTKKISLLGNIELKDISLKYGQKEVLKNISFTIKPGTKTAIIGPTAAGKSQLLYLLSGLIKPNQGSITYGEVPISEIDKDSFYQQLGLVFQDSSIFNLSVRENIAFSDTVTDSSLKKAIDTAELQQFISALPDGLNTVVSERGSSLSGGQKQRMMLARALAVDPKVLLLDDFTARVDTQTEQSILANIEKNYPDLTLFSVTQKIASVEHYDHIILLMEGEILAAGTHKKLLQTSPEYAQLYDSQRSTNTYELQT